ncbi:MAG: hypothetical protein WBA00_12580 [Rhodococcus sp. (in: high G+C Gram-positive bacteria)]
MTTFRRVYGAGPLHLVMVVFCLALALWVVMTLGPALWNTSVWWQSIALWFVGAALLHDLVLFPLYAVADRGVRRITGRWVNAFRIPSLGAALSLALFFPGILSQGSTDYQAATGLTQEPFAMRWLILAVSLYAASAVVYGGLYFARRR